ncbi:uncharacterized protein LOC144747491 [Ciona intestinalis]
MYVLSVVWILLVAGKILDVQGCHAGEGIGRKKRDIASLRASIGTCMQNKGFRGLRWQGPVDYIVLHTTWFTDTESVCSETTNNDTAACWLEQVNSLIGRTSPIFDAVKDCIIDFSNTATGGNYTGDRFESNETETPDDDSNCPTVQVSQYITDFTTFTDDIGVTVQDDTTVEDVTSVIDFMQQDVICRKCTCTELSQNTGVLEEYELPAGLSCGRCWSTRLGALTKSTSEFAEPLGLAAVDTANLERVSTCNTSLVDPTNTDAILDLFNLRVTCEARKVVARVARCTLVGLGLELVQELVIANESATVQRRRVDRKCIPDLYMQNTRDDLVYTLAGELGVCGAEVESNQTHITYTYTIRSVPDYKLSGTKVHYIDDFRVSFSCSYNKEYTVSSSELIPDAPPVRVLTHQQQGMFNVAINFYMDQNYNTTYNNGATITVPDVLYVGLDMQKIVVNTLISLSNR